MMIATILLIANLVSLIFSGVTFMTWGWIIGAFFIETIVYIIFYIIIIALFYVFIDK